MKSTLLKNYFNPLKLNFFTIILFEFLYKALGTFLLFPFLLHLIRNLITGFGTTLMTTENIRLIFQSTSNVLICVIIGVVVLYYFLIEITTLIIGLNCGIENEEINLFELVKRGLIKSLRYLSINNWIAFILILIFIPVLHIGLESGIAEILYLRLYLSYYTDFTFSVSVFVIAILIELILLGIFSNVFTYFVKTNEGILACCSLCFRTLRKHFKETVIEYLKTLIITFLLILALFLCFLLAGLIVYLVLVLSGNETFSVSSTGLYRILINILSPLFVGFFCLFSVLLPILFFSGLIGLNYKKEKITVTENKGIRRLKVALILLIFLFFSVFRGSVIAQSISDDDIHIAQTGAIITAHRGNSNVGYDNTAGAFTSAIENGAEYIEFDIQRTKDGVLVINHSNDLFTTEGAVPIDETNFEELKEYEIINTKTKEPTGETILSLEELLNLAQGKVKLNIELKKLKDEKDLIDQVVALVTRYVSPEDFFIASIDYQYVLEIEEKYPELRTLFLTSSNYGDIENLAFDNLSLEQEAIDEETVRRMHLRGKMIHAWTLVSEEEVLNMLAKDVDFLIVNDVHVAQNVLAANRPTHQEQVEDILELILFRV